LKNQINKRPHAIVIESDRQSTV